VSQNELLRWAIIAGQLVTWIAMITLVVMGAHNRIPTRYSIRTLFIVTTVLSVVLGMIAYLIRK
jgi:hypothetical protein